jgi:signal transduction histidine kinase/DNA-binding response OmpR family regulator
VWIGQHVQLLTEGQDLIGFQAVARDISERMRIQHELQRMRDTALETARLKSEFVANTSHEIRTPLNGIVGFSSLLLDTELNDQQRTYADGLRLSADALLTIVNDILDFSKIEAGMLRLETMGFDLRATIDNATSVFSENVRLKGLALEVAVDAAVPRRVKGDPSRLRQVLTNLIANAIKFTDRGSITVIVSVEADATSHALVRFSVRDSGIGIDPEAQRQLFQPFVQGDGSTSRRYGGTGLGLAISRQIVELMGGSIGVDSEPGAGSTFHFTARLEKELQAAAGPQQSASLAGVRVLVVADPSPFREELVEHAARWGMAIGQAANGSDAETMLRTAAAEKQPYALVLLSLVHPREDSIALARRIRYDAALSPSPKLVLIPSKGVLGDARAAHDNGVVAYLPRPVDGDELRQCLLSIIGEATAASKQAEPTLLPLVTRHSLQEQRMAAGHRVLVADDNPISQQVTKLLVEKLGYLVETAADGMEAVQATGRHRYALVLMDCQMPVMDGYMATAEIRAAEGSDRHTPIVAFTASASPRDRERCLQAGMDDFLEKPIRRNELIEVLNRWASGANASAEAPSQPAPEMTEIDEWIDERAVRALETELGADVLNQMIARLLEEAERSLRRMEAAGDRTGVAEAAHRLKGGALTMGFLRLGRVCARLEDTQDVSSVDLQERLEHLRRACAELRAWQLDRGRDQSVVHG